MQLGGFVADLDLWVAPLIQVHRHSFNNVLELVIDDNFRNDLAVLVGSGWDCVWHCYGHWG